MDESPGGSDAPDRHPKRFVVIREVYENGHSAEEFEAQLDIALQEGVSLILIEPTSLGAETRRWITVGNFLHKSAVLGGLGAFCFDLLLPRIPRLLLGAGSGGNLSRSISPSSSYVAVALGLGSGACAALYALCWQWDPCCKYQVERDGSRLKEVLPLSRLSCSASPVVLVRKEDGRRKLLHNSTALLGLIIISHRIYSWWRPG